MSIKQIDKALEKACNIFPYLPYVLRRVDLTTKASSKSYMKWTKDGMISINIDPLQGDSEDKFQFILLHEVGHIIYAAHLFMDDPRRKESRNLVNVAMDIIINETILDFDISYKNTLEQLGGWSFDVAKKNFNVDLNLEMTWMEIYDLLKPHITFINVASLVDEHSDDYDETSKEIIDNLLEDARISSSIKGLNLPDINYKKTKKLKHEKFKMELSKFVGSLVSYDKKSTIMRPNRRSNAAIKGMKKDKKVNALIAVDVSGSIKTYLKEIETSFSVVLNYCDTVDVLPFNDKIGEIKKNVTRIPEFHPEGGTNFQILEPYHSEYDVVVVISDMDCSEPTFKENNVIYVSSNRPDWAEKKRHVLL